MHDGKVVVVEFYWIQEDVILHGGPAETGIVGDAGNGFVGALDVPDFVSMQLHWGAIGAFDYVTIDEAAGAEERGHAGSDTDGESGVADTLENNFAGKIGIHAFVEGQDKVREAIEGDRTHDMKVRGTIHGEFKRESGEALDLFSGVARPLRDEFDHGRREIGIGVHGHLRKDQAPVTMIKTVSMSTRKRC